MKHERIFEHTTNVTDSAKAVLEKAISALEEVKSGTPVTVKVTISYKDPVPTPPAKDYRI